MSDLLQLLAMMSAVMAFFGTVRYLNRRTARIEATTVPARARFVCPP